MQHDTFKPARFAVLFGAAAMLVALPFQFGVAPEGGLVALKPSMALAKSGSGKDGDGRDDDNGGSGRDDDDDRSGSSGSDDDRSGSSGSSDDSDDDRGRRHGGHGIDDTAAGAGTGGVTGGGAGGGGVTKFEVSATGVEVTFSDGTKQEIENGRFQRKNSAGRTVEERPATQADLDRLLGLN
ncbi:hypothetical protein [Defluviimonas salinarum]|uniref:Uncharacterized protein n=1 Tax=Defluviimonas salinarum TaxID=2992147 RepID=A0ABT3J7V8_9RHOB|nr:hypothetical protein [Defluviimonas salinarum]MCW3783770.1 hypothetical protein [Defluviimonas salinarum]